MSAFHLEQQLPSWRHAVYQPEIEQEVVEVESSLEDRITALKTENSILESLLIDSNLSLRKLLMQQARMSAQERAEKGTRHHVEN